MDICIWFRIGRVAGVLLAGFKAVIPDMGECLLFDGFCSGRWRGR